MKTLALTLLQKSKTVSERAGAFLKGVKRDLELSVIVAAERKLEKIDEKIFELEDFSLKTDKNSGQEKMTQEAVLARFEQIFELRKERTLIKRELKADKKSFAKYFGKEEEAKTTATNIV